MIKLNIAFCSFPDFSSNAKPLYEYMKKRYNNSMNFAWIVNSQDMLEKLNSKGINAYKMGTDEYFEYAKTVDVFFSTHCNIIGEKNDKSIYVELWHGISSKHIGNLSNNITDSDKAWYGNLKRKIDYLIVPSDFWRVIFSTRFNINYSRTLSLGYPKLDYFVYSDAKKNLEKVLDINIKKYSKIIYYMPTFRKGCNRKLESQINEKNILNIDMYDENELFDLLKARNYLLCIKKHPSEELDINYIENDNIRLINDDMLHENGTSLNEIMNAADLMITDYSSLGLEFIFLEKPVIYLVNDIEEYRVNRGITFDNPNFWMPGYKVKNINDLKVAFDNCFSTDYKYKSESKDKKELWFGKLKDGGCKRICDFLFDENKISKNVVRYVDNEELLENNICKLNSLLEEKENLIREKNIMINDLNEVLEEVFNSKGWKFLERIRKIGKIFKVIKE